MHTCVGKLTMVSSDNGLSPGRRQAIICTNAGILLIGLLRKKLQWSFNRNWNIFSQENARQKCSAKWRLFRLGLNFLSSSWKPFPCNVLLLPSASSFCASKMIMFWLSIMTLLNRNYSQFIISHWPSSRFVFVIQFGKKSSYKPSNLGFIENEDIGVNRFLFTASNIPMNCLSQYHRIRRRCGF